MLKKYPFYLKSTIILLGLVLFAYSILHLRSILVPISFAVLLGILLNPMVNKFRHWKIPKVAAILLAIFMAILLTAAVVFFLSSQMIRFGEDVPLLEKRFAAVSSHVQQFIAESFNVPLEKQQQLIEDAKGSLSSLMVSALGTMVGVFAVVFLVPIYTFLFLFYKKLLLNFLFEVFAEHNSSGVADVLKQTRGAIQNYMIGLIMEAMIVTVMNSTALLLIGIQYAILLGVIGAILNLLPYIGGLIAISLPVLIATITEDGYSSQLLIIAVYIVIQFIDNNLIVPYIVSSRVKINALVSIVIVLLGGAVWGVAGMFLSIPFIGILKIIFDRVPDLKPWGKLLGDEIPTRHKGQIWSLRHKKVPVEKI